MKKIKAIDIFYPLTAVIPVAVSMTVCSDIVSTVFLFAALFYSLFYNKANEKIPMQIYVDFLIVNQINSMFGYNTAWLGLIICGVLLLITSFFNDKIKKYISPAVTSAVMISAAFTMTALQTTNYFGIGATGNTVVEMITNYRSLGFHPNWRGILYGTIVMVIMITFPRKFKKISKIIKAPFPALLFVMGLNMVLVPSGMISPFAEVGKIKFELNKFNLSNINYIYAVLSGIALWAANFTLIANENKEERNRSVKLISSTGIVFGTCVPCISASKKDILQRLICILPLLICVPLSIPFARTPVAACAVVLIVGAWQSVKWGELKKAFINPISAMGFLLTVAVTVLTDLSIGITAAVLISIIISLTAKRTDN